MKYKTFFIIFEELSFGEKIKTWYKIVDTSFKLKVVNLFRTSSGVVGGKNNAFPLLFVKKESVLAFGIFLSNLPATDVKRLLKWPMMIWSSEIVLLSTFLDVLV